MVKIVEKLLRAGEGRTVKRLENIAGQVNAIEEDFAKLTDAELRAETDKFKQRLAKGETRRSTTCFPRPSPRCGRPASGPWESVTSTSSSWAARRCTRARSPR